MILYPLSAFRAMSRAAQDVYETLRTDGTQRDLTDRMQTREQLYEVIGYHEAERALDALFAEAKKSV
jgi:methylisocitrate lyase